MQNGQKVQEIASFKVSWFRKGDGMLYFLTVGKDTFVADPRFSLALKKPGPEDGNWCLRIHPTQPGDDGTYLCQISTHPPTLLITHLQVIGEYLVCTPNLSSAASEFCFVFKKRRYLYLQYQRSF